MLQQDAKELKFLEGGIIYAIKEVSEDDGFGGEEQFVEISVRCNTILKDGPVEGKTAKLLLMQDPEGNGPGYLMLTEILP